MTLTEEESKTAKLINVLVESGDIESLNNLLDVRNDTYRNNIIRIS